MANSAQKIPKGSGVRIQPRNYTPKPTGKPISTALATNPQKFQPPQFSPAPPARQLSPLLRGLLWGATVSLTALASATVGGAIALVSPLAPSISTFVAQGSNHWLQALSAIPGGEWGSLLQYKLDRPLNILVLGIDRVLDAPADSPQAFRGRSDTMLLMRFEPESHSLRLLSIPRDSRVEIPGAGYGKINDANVHGGAAVAAQVVSKTLNNVPIDRYLRVTTDTFKELVDLVGGVEVFVPYAMSYQDVTQKLDINLQPGRQTLNGEQAEQFARFRKDGYGDIGRVQRQQVLLKALQQRLYNPAILLRLPQALKIFQKNVDTNLSWEEMLALVNFARGLQREDTQMVMLPGRFSQPEEYDSSFWLISRQGRNRVMQQYFKVGSEGQLASEPTSRRLRIGIQNATDDPGLANRLQGYLAKQEYRHVYLLPDSPQKLQETEIVVQKGDLQAAANLKTVLQLGRVEASSTGDLDSDLTVRLGSDAEKLLAGDSFVN
jgi:LCP family protein required for cell wall assembly